MEIHTHTSDIDNLTITVLSNTRCASWSIHHNWLSNRICIGSRLGHSCFTCLSIMGSLKKMKFPWEYANIYTFPTCWSQCCYVIWNMHVFEFPMSDFLKRRPRAGVSRAAWSVTDVAPAVNLVVVLCWLLGQHALSLWNSWTITPLSSLLLFYSLFFMRQEYETE